MKQLMGLTVGLTVFLGLGLAQFVDVPPCHWAKGAIETLTKTEAQSKPQPTAFLAANAVQQVFEGLKCGDTRWSARFILNAPNAFVEGAGKLQGFELQNVRVQISGNQATVKVTLRLNLGAQAMNQMAEFRLSFTEQGWKVDYRGLAALGLWVFPR